ncbi:MAG: RNA 2',3'-cyclic phosphodiesterase [Solobacterium sp.]|nr:RNA 2',3'-cyclic phosphodiesterase [Solobacterium sp.]
MRLFIALRLSEEMIQSAVSAVQKAKEKGIGGKPVPADNMHVTLAFIGETDSPQPVISALQSITFRPFRLSLDTAFTVRDMLWLKPESTPELTQTAESVRSALSRAGIPYDRKPFRPHITLMRRVRGTVHLQPVPETEMTVTKISLMQSVSSDGKTIYREIYSVNAAEMPKQHE